jgi:hypothetical protein
VFNADLTKDQGLADLVSYVPNGNHRREERVVPYHGAHDLQVTAL